MSRSPRTARKKEAQDSRAAAHGGTPSDAERIAALEAEVGTLRSENAALQRGIAACRRSEASLKESRERLRSILDHSLDALYRRNLLTGRADYYSPAIELLTGFTVEESLAMPMDAILGRVHPDDLPWVRDAKQNPASLTAGGTIDYRFRRKDGTYRWFSDRFRILFDEEGRPVAREGVIRDITEQKQAEADLEASELRYRTMVENALDAIVIVDGEKILYLNPTGRTLLGISRPEEILGRAVLSIVHPHFRDSVQANIAQDQLGEPTPILQFPLLRQDGTSVWVEGRGVRTDFGGKPAVQIVLRDISDRRQAEAELRSAIERERLRATELDATLASIASGVIIYDRSGSIIRVNEAVRRMIEGTSPSLDPARFEERREMFGVVRADGTPLPREAAPYYRALHGETVRGEEVMVTRLDREPLWVDTAAAPIRDGSGAIVGAIAILTDITERKRAEEALLESEARYRRIVETANEGIWTIDADHRTTYVNRRTAEILGYTPQEMLGRSPAEFLFPEDVETVKDQLKERSNGTPATNLEKRYRKKDGSCVWVNMNTVPLYDDRGNYAGALGMIADITERKRAEDALRTANELLESRVRERTEALALSLEALKAERHRLYDVLETLPIYVCLLDEDYRMPFANRTFRDNFGESQGRRCYEFLFNRTEPCEHCESYTVMKTRAPHQWYWTGPNGRDYEIHDLPFPDSDGSLLVLEMGIDITDLRKAEAALKTANEELETRIKERTAELAQANLSLRTEVAERRRAEEALKGYAERLRRSNEDLERFAYISSHDLQEPIRTMVTFAQLLEKRYAGRIDRDADEYIHYIVRAGKRMQSLINDLLEFSRVNTKGMEFRPTDANAIVEEALAGLQTQTVAEGVTITVDHLPDVMADPGQLRQVFQNLIGNALKYRRADTPSEIRISAREVDRMVRFSVADNGIGIEPQYFDRIFVIFQRLHGMDQYEGTGIGLALVKRIVERHGGRIWVESEPGKGSTFHFTLPPVRASGDGGTLPNGANILR